MLCWPSLLQKYWYHVIVHLFKGTSEKDMHLGVFSEFVLITVDSCNSKEQIVVCSVFTDGENNHFSRYRKYIQRLKIYVKWQLTLVCKLLMHKINKNIKKLIYVYWTQRVSTVFLPPTLWTQTYNGMKQNFKEQGRIVQ